ncbi:hypothetical protein [Sphingomonas sp.]|uniref:hypothetical protein n=1 Tax=Sphingomonas sp. TaxID=28214 RepID=UPI001B292D4F|nr:hypothetical protein [Sphingomonas sp.]MBO9712194.1 DUF11 domain-containing protein [Sphingomonas sp.]
MSISKLRKTMVCGGSLAALLATPAFAQSQTAAGTSVNNQASVSYDVGGSTQTVSSNVATFVVDKKINLAVAEVGGAVTQTALGATNQVTTFTVTNLSNSVQDFRLDPDQQTISIPLLGTDNFDVTNMRAFVDSNGNGVYDAGVDTATYIDELAPDATVTVFIVANIPNTPGADTAIVSLNAVAATGGSTGVLGADVVATSILTADSSSTVEIVFADGSGPLDLARNGQGRAFDAYHISTAVVTLSKASHVVSDPVNLLLNPHAIPGATIEYCMTIANAGPGIATNVAVADNVPANTTFVPGSISVGTAGLGCILLGTTEDDNNTGSDESDPFGGSFDGTTVRATLPSVAPLTSYAVSFRVTVN